MKTIENKKIKIPGDVKDYSDLIMYCVKNPPKDGYDIVEMRKRMKIIDTIEKGGDSLEFEDSDFESVKQCVKNMRWASVHKDIIDFSDYITSL